MGIMKTLKAKAKVKRYYPGVSPGELKQNLKLLKALEKKRGVNAMPKNGKAPNRQIRETNLNGYYRK
jgi:hypothetical protein